MSTISASTTTTTAYKVTADTTGTLVLQTGSTPTTAVTVGTDQSVTFAQAANLPNTFGFKNRIINGAMVIDQRNAGASGTASAFTVDRFAYVSSQASKGTWQQNAGSVTPPAGFKNYLGFTSSSAYSVLAGDYFTFRQGIEGFNTFDLGFGAAGASTVSLSFWVRSSLTGTFGVVLSSGNASRGYPATYTISSANTWEYKTITIPGDTSGTWVGATNAAGMLVDFGLGVGSTYSATANAWGSGNIIGATGATSVVGTNGATFYITGVQLEKGSTATSFDYRPYGTELALCQRYCPVFIANPSGGYQPFGVGQCASTTAALITLVFPVSVRTPPTGITISAGSDFSCWQPSTSATAATGMSFNTATYLAGVVQPTGMSGLTQGYATTLLSNNTASSKIIFNGCEL